MQRKIESGNGGRLSRRSLVKGAAIAAPALGLPSLGMLTQPAAATDKLWQIHPGNSSWDRAANGMWQYTWRDATIRGFTASDVPTSLVRLRWQWSSTSIFSTPYMRARDVSAPNWSFPAAGTTDSILDYTYQLPVTSPGTTIPIPDGIWFDFDSTDPYTTQGYARSWLTVNDLSKDYPVWLKPLAPPTPFALFTPGTSTPLVVGPQFPSVAWEDAKLEVVGSTGFSLPAKRLYVKVGIASRFGSLPAGTKLEDFDSKTFTGWKLSRISNTSFQYLYQSAVPEGLPLSLLPGTAANPVAYFYGTTAVVPGSTQFKIEVGDLAQTITPVVYHFNF